ncbi:MAG: hypothetical protein HDT16_04175 [Oscillibacter sp.]|nr:hypothetical protein [Oscillibacter sp.]
MKRGGGVSGAVSLVMIFCVLCLAVFSVLTIATADREAKLAEMTARNAADYYKADRQAVEIVAALRSGDALPMDVEIVRTGNTAAFSLPVGENQALEVVLGENGEILRWQTEYTGSWETDDSWAVWDGE